MDLGLNRRSVMVTGASRGLGREIARSFAREGANLILCARNFKDLQEAGDEISRSFAIPVELLKLDVADPLQVREELSRLHRLDVLVNNVGGAEKFGNFFDLAEKDWDDAWKLNFMSMVHVIRQVVPLLRQSGRGRIINISSVPARQPGFFNPHYSAAKAAMLNLSKYLAGFLAKDNILVNSVCPGTLRGGGWERNIANKSQRLQISLEESRNLMEQEEGKKVPLGRVGTLGEVAELVAFLASDRASFITGTCIDVDGGVVRSVT